MGFYSLIRSVHWVLAGYPADSYRHLLDLSEHWSREQMENYRNDKLRKLIAHAYENVPYYKRVMDENKISPRDIRCAEDLVKLPPLTRDIIRTYSGELMAKNISKMTITWSKTGGTTGEPIRICKDRACTAWGSMCYERGLRWGGLDVDKSRVRLFGGSLGIDKTRFTARLTHVMRRDLFLPAFELQADTAISYFDKIRHSKSRFLLGYSSAIYRLAMFAKEMNQKIEFSAVFPTAELMLPEWEKIICKVFKCAVLPYYGCGEVNSLGYHILGTNAYLIPEEHALIEVLQNDRSTTLFGEGRFLITDLDNYAMPIIRYANGDAGKISGAEEGSAFTRIERLDGRYNSFLMRDTGDLISGTIGPHVFRHLSSVQSYRIIQEEPLRLVIKVVPNSDFLEEHEHLIEGLFARYLGSKMKISIEKVRELTVPPSGKTVFVINRCLESPLADHNGDALRNK